MPASTTRDSLFVGGTWVPSSGSGTIDVIDSTTEEVFGSVPEGTPEDVDAAVRAAREALPAWSRTPVAERTAILAAVGAALAERTEELADLITHEVGMPRTLSQIVQVGLPTGTFHSMAQVAADFAWEEPLGSSLIVREPVGVVGAITPWNYPLHQIAAKVAPALAAGCTVVVKPSEVAPLNAFVLAEIFDGLDLPAGVFNLVTGYGPVVGEAIAGHPGVDMVSFTGSTRAGKRVLEVAAATVKRVALELGGKSANVILDDADFDKAVADGVFKCFLNSGQTCNALTRMLVPRDRLADAEADARWRRPRASPRATHSTRARGSGRSCRPSSAIGCAHTSSKGIGEGATLLTGGVEAPDGLDHGFFVRPTVFTSVTREMTIAREEIFGPVLSIMPYDTGDEAVAIANDTDYGLAGAVWSGDPERGQEIARRLRAGQVEVNGGNFNPMAPFGGYKQSGIGREFGAIGLEEFLEVKSLQL